MEEALAVERLREAQQREDDCRRSRRRSVRKPLKLKSPRPGRKKRQSSRRRRKLSGPSEIAWPWLKWLTTFAAHWFGATAGSRRTRRSVGFEGLMAKSYGMALMWALRDRSWNGIGQVGGR